MMLKLAGAPKVEYALRIKHIVLFSKVRSYSTYYLNVVGRRSLADPTVFS